MKSQFHLFVLLLVTISLSIEANGSYFARKRYISRSHFALSAHL